jgi:hypothetical protein
MNLDEIRQTVAEIDSLNELMGRLGNFSSREIIETLLSIPSGGHWSFGENNTTVLLDEAADRLLSDVKSLVTYEVGERMKKLKLPS